MRGHLSGEAPSVDEMPFLSQEQVRVVEHIRATSHALCAARPRHLLCSVIHDKS